MFQKASVRHGIVVLLLILAIVFPNTSVRAQDLGGTITVMAGESANIKLDGRYEFDPLAHPEYPTWVAVGKSFGAYPPLLHKPGRYVFQIRQYGTNKATRTIVVNVVANPKNTTYRDVTVTATYNATDKNWRACIPTNLPYPQFVWMQFPSDAAALWDGCITLPKGTITGTVKAFAGYDGRMEVISYKIIAK